MNPTEAIERAERELRAGRALFRDGLLPECHGHVVRALHAAIEAWVAGDAEAGAAPGEEARESSALLLLQQQGYGDLERLRTALASGVGKELPATFEATWAETERLVRFSAAHLAPERVRRRRRMLSAAGLAVALVVVIVVVGRLWGRQRARASAVYSPEYPAAYAVDGIDTTEWLLPDETLGWVDVYLPRPTGIREVVVLNGHNRFYMDRATKRVRVTAYAGHEELGAAEGDFAGIKDGRSPLTLKLRASGVTRLRLEALAFFGAGATIAEVELR